MRKKTSTIIGLTIATILTAYILALSLSNQAFAQHLVNPTTLMYGKLGQTLAGQSTQLGQTLAGQSTQLGQTLAGQSTQLGKVLGSHPGLGNNELAQLGKILAGHEAQLGKAGHSLGDVCLSCWGG